MTVIKKGGDMKVVGLTSKVQEILKVTKLHQVLQEFESEESALSSFPEKSRAGSPLKHAAQKNGFKKERSS